jgi:quinol monooxygenase YgiN
MDQKALFVGIEADPGKEGEVAEFLLGALGPVEQEPDTRDWYAIRFAPAQFAIFDTFPDNAGRLKHLLGQVGRSLIVKTFTILDGLPDIRPADVLAAKSPTAGRSPRLCLHVPLQARAGREGSVAGFLVGAKPLVNAEPGTLSWYALRLSGDSFAIVDFFADESGRAAHLSGQVAAALMQRAGELFAAPPEIRRGEVLASKAGG